MTAATSSRRRSRSLGLIAMLSVLTLHAAAFGWAVSVSAHLVAAGWFLAQAENALVDARISGGKVARSVEIVVTLPPAPQPTPVIELVAAEAFQPPVDAASRHPAPDDTMPLLDALAMARAGEARPVAPRRNVSPAEQELFAHTPAAVNRIERSHAAARPLEIEEPQPHRVPRSESQHRPPAPQAAASVPSTLGTEVDDPAEPIYNPPPVYPAVALAGRQEGRVVLQLTINPMGNVARVSLLTSSGVTALDQAALEAIRQWRFRPALREGRPVEWTCELPIRFRLD